MRKRDKVYSSLSEYYRENPQPSKVYDSSGKLLGTVGSVGMRLKGTVVKLTEHEATIRFGDGRLGTLGSQDFAWGRERDALRHFLQIGAAVKVVVLRNQDPKLTLGRKQLYVDPWVCLGAVKKRDRLRGSIRSVSKTKIWVGVDPPPVEGNAPYSVIMGELLLSAPRRGGKRSDFKVGAKISATVRNIEASERTLILENAEIYSSAVDL